MAAATWPDLVKGAGNQGYTDPKGDHDDGPAVTEVTFDHIMHKAWHFIDQPIWVGEGPQGKLPEAPKVNAVGVVNILIKQLHGREAVPAQAYDLGWLLHLVGDLHQPLHAVTGYSKLLPKGDAGGNDVVIKGDVKGARELHGFWDDILGKEASPTNLTADINTANTIIALVQNNAPSGNQLDPATWAFESKDMAQKDVYNLTLEPLTRGDKPQKKVEATIDSTYGATAADDARARIRTAGHRLALLLQSILQALN